MNPDLGRTLRLAIDANDTAGVERLFDEHPELKPAIDGPLPGGAFGGTPLLAAVSKGNRAMIDVLLRAGADINARSHWWAGSFGVLDGTDPAMVPFLIDRGATVDAYAAAGLGMIERLAELIAADPEVVHTRGGDGQTPLHVAATVDVARLLLDRGADIDAHDVDHESTAAQYAVRERQDVSRHLIARGCRTDLLMASAVGDLALVRAHLDRDPARTTRACRRSTSQ